MEKNGEFRRFPFSTVSVTGANGTVASQFIRELRNRFAHVEHIAASCRNPDSSKARETGASSKVSLLAGGILDFPVLQQLVREGELVFHLAAWLANTEMPDTHEDIFAINSLSTAVIGKLCARAGKRFVFPSSHSVYFAGEYKGIIAEDTYQFRPDFLDWIQEVKSYYYDLADRIIAGDCILKSSTAEISGIHRKMPPPFSPTIYERDDYHLYCLTKLLAETFAVEHGGIVLRLSNVYGPGDDSPQAVSEACQRILAARKGDRIAVRQPFKKLVPVYMGDIIEALIRAGSVELPSHVPPVFTMASQATYLREDDLLKSAVEGLSRIRGADDFEIETLPPEESSAFTYDLAKLRNYLLPGYRLTPFVDGLEAQLRWLIDKGQNAV